MKFFSSAGIDLLFGIAECVFFLLQKVKCCLMLFVPASPGDYFVLFELKEMLIDPYICLHVRISSYQTKVDIWFSLVCESCEIIKNYLP